MFHTLEALRCKFTHYNELSLVWDQGFHVIHLGFRRSDISKYMTNYMKSLEFHLKNRHDTTSYKLCKNQVHD